jgi:hypothetical protein
MFNQLLLFLLCAIPLLVGMLGLGVVATQARIQIVRQTNHMKAQGTYQEWRRKNKAVLLFERILIIVILASLVCIIFSSKLSPQVAYLAFTALVLSGILGPLSLFWLHRVVTRK